MFFSFSSSLPGGVIAGSAVPSPLVQNDVFRGVLMPVRAMGFVSLVVGSMTNSIKHVFGRCIPTKVFQPVVERVGIRRVARFLTRSRRANEGHQDKTMNLVSSSGFSRKGDMRSPVDDNGCERFSFEPLDLSVCALHNSVQGSNVSPVGNFVHPFITGNREPSFVSHAVNNITPDTIGVRNRETHYEL